MTITMSYQLADGPPAVRFSDYERESKRALADLLNSGPEEPEVQRFLESHPSIVPGAWTSGGTCPSQLYCMLVSQPRLTGLDGRRPDFMWLTANSDTWFPVLIEIEKPSKRLFRKDAVPSAEFTQARNQLDQWRAWFSEPENQIKFRTDYGVPQTWIAGKAMRLRVIMIYGRRSEFEQDGRLSKHRSSLLTGGDAQLMSFDRIFPDPLLRDALTVRAIGPGRYRALSTPPTLTLGPASVERLLVIEGLKSAIDSSDGWQDERRRFVKDRLPYWREWAKNKGVGGLTWSTAGDRE